MKKRIISLFIILALLMPMTTVFEQQKSVVQAEETTEDEYIEITNAAELYAIRNNLSANYRLMNDIDLTEATSEGGELNNTGHGWDPIDGFSGVFDGNGHYIKGMQIYGTFDDAELGLFGETAYKEINDDEEGTIYQSAIIKNLGMVDMNISIEVNEKSEVYFGGIIGGSRYAEVRNCFVSGNINVTSNKYYSESYIGGLMANYYSSKCINCINMAKIDVIGNYEELGGINSRGNVDNCINLGTVTCNGNLSYALSDEYDSWSCPAPENSYYLLGSGICNKDGGTPLTDVQMKNKAFFTNYDFDNTWVIDNYSTYKYPQLRSCMFNRVKELEMEQLPQKVVYEQGEKLDFTGALLTITYENDYNTTIMLTKDYLGKYDMTKIGEQQIPVVVGNKTVYFNITINPVPVTQINLNDEWVSVNKGYTHQLIATVLPYNATDKTIVWSSEDENIVSVDSNGIVTGKNKGTTTITATSSEGVIATCQVTVTIPCVVLQLDKYDITINKGESFQMTYKMSPLDCTDTVKWTSDDENILSVDVDNNWIGKNAGNVIVTGETESGVTAICTVTVMQDLSEFTVIDIVNKNYTGKEITQTPTVTNGSKTLKAGIDYSISYSSNIDVGIATMVITGITPYKGSLTRTFNILQAELTEQIPSDMAGEKPSDGIEQKTTNLPEENQSDSAEKIESIKLTKGNITAIKAAKKKLTIRWKKVKNVVGYEIQVAQNKKITKGKKTYRVNAKTLKKVFKGSKKKTYYVRVRAYTYDADGEIVNGSFSKIKKMKTK